MRRLRATLLLFTSLLVTVLAATDRYEENLVITPLPAGDVLTQFNFTTTWDVNWLDSTEERSHYHLVSKPLAEVLSKYSVLEMHLSLTQSRWLRDTWGALPNDVETPPGAQLIAWFHPSVPNVDVAWRQLTSALSGVSCASLNFMDTQNTIQPRWALAQLGVSKNGKSMDTRYLRYAQLPREGVCTGQLTPWRKLLPCGHAGLAGLLRPEYIFDGKFASVTLHVTPVCGDAGCKKTALQITQTLTAVLTPPKPNDFGLTNLFNGNVEQNCVLGDSTVKFAVFNGASIEPLGKPMGEYHAYHSVEAGNVHLRSPKPPAPPAAQPLVVSRHVTGYGRVRGGLMTEFTNNLAGNVTIVYMQILPWQVKTYLHTLHMSSGALQLQPVSLHFIPARQRESPGHLEVILSLPPQQKTQMLVEFEYHLLKWTEYPPDANHGFYIPSGYVTAMLTDGSVRQLFTESLLVNLPTPDFSMPYNVICLVCTIVAIGFGTVHSLTTKRFVLSDPDKPPETTFQRFKSRLFGPGVSIQSQFVAPHSTVVDKEPADVVEEPS